jgi:adenylate cyclase
LTRAIHYYVPKDAVRELHEDGKPHQRRKLVYGVCMCSDVADYTKLAEAVSPEQLVELDNEYFEALGLVIEQRGGRRLDLTGDGSMSLWEAPQPASDLRLRACLAGLEIIRASVEFNERHQGQAFQTRIGLHAGWVVMANIGGGGHYAYKAVGDVPPTASRIESLNKELGTRLLASEPVVVDLASLLVRPVGRFILKGKAKADRVYEIRGRSSEATPEELAFISRFQEALDFFESSRWGDAEHAFKAVLTDFPEDGPSRFFIDRSIFNQRSKSADITDPIIRLTHK